MNEFLNLVSSGVMSLAPYQPGKPIDELQRELGLSNIIKLASNESPFEPDPAVLKLISESFAKINRYPDGNGYVLKQMLAEKYNIQSDQLTLGNGSNDVLDMVARAFTSPGSEVVFSEFGFAVYPIVTKAANAKAIITKASDWGHDLVAMKTAINSNTRLIFIANPNNPTGTWLSRSELLDFIDNIPGHIVVVVDEAYFEFASYMGMGSIDYGSVLERLPEYPNLIITRTFSKAYGMAGLRAGFAISHPQVADILNRVRHPFNVNNIALRVAEAVLGDDDNLRKTMENNVNGLNQLKSGFDQMQLQYIESAGNFICVKLGESTNDIYEQLLHKGIIVRPVDNYGMPEYLRISVGLEHENAVFLQALGAILN